VSKLERFLEDLPHLHTWDGGKTWNAGGFYREAFEQIRPLIPAKARFIETGAGNSTIFFLLQDPACVVSIAPDAALFERIGAYCDQQSIPTEPLTSVIDGSQWALPKLATRSDPSFDFALIDGHHGWPMVFVDFQYVNYLLKPSGLLMLDDVQLYSVSELVALLNEQWGYDIVCDGGKFVVFRKTTEARELPDFGGQPYIVRRGAPKRRTMFHGWFKSA
jgi:hypothetical protein